MQQPDSCIVYINCFRNMLAFVQTRFLYEDPVARKCAVSDAKTGLEGFIACVAKQIKY